MPRQETQSDEALSQDWREQRRQVRKLLKQFPHALRREVERAFRSDIQHDIADEIMNHVLALGRARGVVRMVASMDLFRPQCEHMPAAHKRAILRDLANDREYVQHVHRTVDQRLRTAHLAKINPEPTRMPELFEGAIPSSVDGRLPLASDLGLGTASALDEAPDGFYVRTIRTMMTPIGGGEDLTLGVGGDSRGTLRCLVLDPRGGALARAAAALNASDTIRIQEVGPEFVATGLPSVVADRMARIRPQAFDYAVWAVPAPAAPGAANQVQAYRMSLGQDLRELVYRVGANQIRVRAPSTLGPTQWLRSVAVMMTTVVAAALKPGGTAILRMPEGIRVYQRPRAGRRGAHGYLAVPNLIEPIVDGLPALGFDLVDVARAVEDAPVNQPFVGFQRCPFTILTIRKREDATCQP